MTTIALLHTHYDKAHLSDVMAKMEELGAPTIRAVWVECHGVWAALEGCHRIRAAHALGFDVKIEEVEYSEETLVSLGLDVQDDDLTVAMVADDVGGARLFNFAD